MRAKTVSAAVTASWGILTGVLLWTASEPDVLASAAGIMAAIVSAWLGFDVSKVKDRTYSLPAGSSEKTRVFRYVYCSVCCLALICIAVARHGYDGAPLAITILTGAAGAPMALLVASVNVSKNGRDKHEQSTLQ